MVNPNRFYTYAYLRKDRTPYYIGKGTGDRVYKKRKSEIKPPKDNTRIIYLKQNLTEEEAFKHEIYMIAVFGRKDLGTGILHNRTDGGEGSSGVVQSDQHKKKISKANKGRTFSEEHKRKISEAKKGKTLSEKHKRKIGVKSKGKTLSEETRRKLSEVNKGKTISEETRRKLSESNKGKTRSEETKEKMRQQVKGRKWWNDGCGNSKQSVECPGNDWVLGRQQVKGRKWWNDGCGNSKMMVECPGNEWSLGRVKKIDYVLTTTFRD
jgi:hypothetical protein